MSFLDFTKTPCQLIKRWNQKGRHQKCQTIKFLQQTFFQNRPQSIRKIRLSTMGHMGTSGRLFFSLLYRTFRICRENCLCQQRVRIQENQFKCLQVQESHYQPPATTTLILKPQADSGDKSLTWGQDTLKLAKQNRQAPKG